MVAQQRITQLGDFLFVLEGATAKDFFDTFNQVGLVRILGEGRKLNVAPRVLRTYREQFQFGGVVIALCLAQHFLRPVQFVAQFLQFDVIRGVVVRRCHWHSC